MIARPRILDIVVAVALFSPTIAGAQTLATRSIPAAPAAARSMAGPRVELTATAVRQHAQSRDSVSAAAVAARRKSMGQPIALMIVGGAAIILGAVIGGDAGTLFMIGGAVTGLFGLYQYLQ